MAATANLTADFTTPGLKIDAVPHRVYTRTRWGDEWQLAPYLWCDEASFGLSPDVSSAELSWNYGRLMQHNATAWAKYLPDDGSRRYVKIVWTVPYSIAGETKDLVWYGVIQSASTLQGGVRSAVFPGNPSPQVYETGKQRIICVGLESLLQDCLVRSAYWKDESDGNIYRIERGLTFNRAKADGTPGGNRSQGKDSSTYVYSGKVLDDDAFWSASTIIPYLLRYHSPRDKESQETIPFALHPDSQQALKGWTDKPIIDTDGKNLREIFNQLLPQERLLTWWLDVEEVEDGRDKVQVQVATLTGEQVALPSNEYVTPNPRRLTVQVDAAHADVMRVISHHEEVDRVILRGPRSTSTWTAAYADNTINQGWTEELETEFNNGATGTPAYEAAANTSTKRTLNAHARSRDKLREVFSRMMVPHNWDGKAKNGKNEGDAKLVFPLDEGEEGRKFYQRELYLLPTLPLRDSYNYQTLQSGGGTPIPPTKVGDGPFNELAPMVFVPYETPEEVTFYVAIERYGSTSGRNPKWSGRVRIPTCDRSIVIEVESEAGQQVIARSDFTPISGIDPDYELSDWRDFIFTVAAEADYHCEGIWPPKAQLPTSDHIRELKIDAPGLYRLDWLVPGTVIGITNGGELIRCTDGGWINDDRKKLEDRAKMAHGWYGKPRRAVEISTSLINGSIRRGDFLVSIGQQIQHEVNCVISRIRISQPVGSNTSPPPPPRITYTTEFVQDIELF